MDCAAPDEEVGAGQGVREKLGQVVAQGDSGWGFQDRMRIHFGWHVMFKTWR